MNKLILKIFPLILLSALFSTVGCKKKDKVDLTKAFVKYYGSINAAAGTEVLQTSDGGYVLAGTSSVGTSSDIIIIKTDPEGNESWHKTYGGPNYDECGSLAIMPDGGYVLIGTYGKTTRKWDVNALEATKDSTMMYAIRLDASGNTVWEKTYPASSPYAQIGTFGRGVVVNSTGECLLAGMIDSSYITSGNLLINLDLYAFLVGTDGNLLQVLNPATNTIENMIPLRYGTIDKPDITFNAIASVSKSNEYLISSSAILGGQNTPRLVSCTLSGIALLEDNAPTKTDWSIPTMYDGAQVSKTNDNNYVLTGSIGNPLSGSSDIYLIKLSAAGITKINSWNYGDSSGSLNEGVSAIATTDGGYAMLGITNSVTYTGNSDKLNDVILIKVDQNGVEQWHKDFGGRGNDVASTIIQTTDGGYLICGTIAFGEDGSAPGSSNSITLIKVNSNGDISNIK
jgi:hypothetical protein